ncbi:MAG TPA: cation diffusion facilitator family transporter [bacterium]|jgi:cobalt-zinc-cadmium efflux system protein
MHPNHTHHAGEREHAANTEKRRRALVWAFWLNAAFLIIEVIGGWISGSLALLADAGHMLSDVAALGVALWASYAMLRPANAKRTYGYGRIEVLSGLLNGLVLWVVVGFIVFEALQRVAHPQTVNAYIMLPVAVAGLLANLASAWMLHAHQHDDLNVKAAFLHLVADAAGSVSAILAGVAIWVGGWTIVDVAASIIISVLILFSTWTLLRSAIHILLEGSPPHIDLQALRNDLNGLTEAESCHDLHVWLIGSGEPMLTAHLLPASGCDPDSTLCAAQDLLKEKYGITHCTLQIEPKPCPESHL